MVPSASVDALPFNVVLLVGKVMVVLLPALAVGAWLGAAFTVMVTVEEAVAPPLSVTFNVNTYTPWERLLTAVVAAPALAIV